jgi:hypothetical protein
LDELLALLSARLAADDFAEATDLLWCAIDPVHSAARHRDR